MRLIEKNQVARTIRLFGELAQDKVFVTTHESPTRFEVRTSAFAHVRLAAKYRDCETASTEGAVFTLLMPNFDGFRS